MKLAPFVPSALPPKDLDWGRLASPLGAAREQLARYDETLRSVPLSILEILKWEESISTLRSQNIDAGLREALRFSLDKEAEEKRAASLQKILFAKEGLDFGIKWSRTSPLNSYFLCKIHALVKRDAPNPAEIGCFRKRQNWIGAQGCPIEEAYFFPPKARFVPKYIKEWAVYQNKRNEPLVQLAILFAQLLIIHPFMDGNGRVARIHIPAFLYKKKLLSQPFLFMSPYFEAHQIQYFQKLFNLSEESDWESWILYFLKGISIRAQRMEGQVRRIRTLYSKVGQEEPFIHPLSLKKRKNLTEHPKGVYSFDPLFEAVR